MKSIKEEAVMGVKWTSVATILAAAFQFFQLLVLSRLLAPKDFGIVAITVVFLGFVRTFADLGISSAVIHFQKMEKIELSTLFWLNILSGILIYIFILTSYPLIIYFVNEPEVISVIPILATTFLLSPFGTLFYVLFQKDLLFKKIAIIEIITSFFSMFLAIILAFLDYGYWSLVWSQILNIGLRGILFGFTGLRSYKIALEFNINSVKKYLKFGFYQIGERSINFLSEKIDQLLIGSILGITALGYYNFAFNIISQPLVIINPIFTRVALPVFSKMQDNKEFLKNTFLKLVSIISKTNAFIYLLIIFCAPIIVEYVFDPKWVDSIILIQILAVVGFFRAVSNPVGSLILAKGRADIGFYWNVGLFIFSVPILSIAAFFGNIVVVAISLIIIQVILAYPNYRYLIFPFIGKCSSEYFKLLLFPVLIAIITLLISSSFFSLNLFNETFVSNIIGLIVLCCFYLISLYIYDKNFAKEMLSILRTK